jgi:hypothetical protein
MALAQSYLTDILRTFRYYKQLGDRALAQVSDADLHRGLDGESNSIALVIKHLSGNLRSRFGNFLTSDGEKPDRDRDAEFEMPEQASREQVIGWWDEAWKVTFSELEALKPDDVERTVTIRQEPFQAFEALNRLAAHTAYHVGQIVYLAKHFAGPAWTSLSIPKGMSKQATGKYKQIATPSRT